MEYGQWLGRIRGSNNGHILLSIDRDRPAVGWLQVADDVHPHSAVAQLTTNGQNVTGHIHDYRMEVPPPAGVRMPVAGHFTGELHGDVIDGTWDTDAGTNGTFQIARHDDLIVRQADRVMGWRDFRQWILDEVTNSSSMIFRGHSKASYFLMTSFHRTGRRSLLRYTTEDISTLCREVEATVGTTYDLNDANDYGGLLYLAQHHGYPTPLLDWTMSPFVASYFAFRDVDKNIAPGSSDDYKVRILAFDLEGWPHNRVNSILQLKPTFARLNLRATHNLRALPQQSVPMFSNFVNVEQLIWLEEERLHRRFLQRIDLVASDRNTAMRELAAMGVTAGSLFPGLDGLCRTLTERSF